MSGDKVYVVNEGTLVIRTGVLVKGLEHNMCVVAHGATHEVYAEKVVFFSYIVAEDYMQHIMRKQKQNLIASIA